MMDLEPFNALVGTVQVERRMIEPGRFATLRFRVEGVKHKGASRFTSETVAVWGRCIEWPEAEDGQPVAGPHGGNTTWQDAYCSNITYSA